MTCVRVMVVARLPAGAGVHMEKSHWREYCPSVGLSQVIWREGEGWSGRGRGLQTRQAHYHLCCSEGTDVPTYTLSQYYYHNIIECHLNGWV